MPKESFLVGNLIIAAISLAGAACLAVYFYSLFFFYA